LLTTIAAGIRHRQAMLCFCCFHPLRINHAQK
jgi:hypothetical protein